MELNEERKGMAFGLLLSMELLVSGQECVFCDPRDELLLINERRDERRRAFHALLNNMEEFLW